jgi:NAD(P)-dependent dehydrogenase (short-subunit alcohol dehydrogenase family)
MEFYSKATMERVMKIQAFGGRFEAAARTIDGDARALQFDVTDRASIAAAVERIRKELGRLDVLVNNAAS